MFVAASVTGISPVLAEDRKHPVLFPKRNFNIGSAPRVVGTEIVIVPDRKHGRPCRELSPFRTRLTALVSVLLHSYGFGIINVDVVTQQQDRAGIEAFNRVPHAFVFGNVAGSTTECDAELGRGSRFGKRSKLLIGIVSDVNPLAVLDNRIGIFGVRFESID